MSSKVDFLTETWILIEPQKILLNRNWYVVLGTVQLEENFNQMENMLLDKDLKLAQKYLYNQTKNKMKNYHFGTSGSIFSLSNGPIYTRSPVTKHSIDRFSNSK